MSPAIRYKYFKNCRMKKYELILEIPNKIYVVIEAENRQEAESKGIAYAKKIDLDLLDINNIPKSTRRNEVEELFTTLGKILNPFQL